MSKKALHPIAGGVLLLSADPDTAAAGSVISATVGAILQLFRGSPRGSAAALPAIIWAEGTAAKWMFKQSAAIMHVRT